MGITFGDHLIDIGYYDPEEEPMPVEPPVGNARRLAPGQCVYCDKFGDDPMFPSHTPSPRCESGKRPHCTCDTCF